MWLPLRAMSDAFFLLDRAIAMPVNSGHPFTKLTRRATMDTMYDPILQWSQNHTEPTKAAPNGKQKIFLPDGQWHEIHFPFGDSRPTQYNSMKYAARYADENVTIFANRKLHNALLQAGIVANSTFLIKREMGTWEKDGETLPVANFEIKPAGQPDQQEKPVNPSTDDDDDLPF